MDNDKYIGRLLDNRYEILEVIGTGGMAVVYKARCHRLNRLVAIKILKDDLSQDEEFRRRFHAESQAVAMLSHPNIMSVYDVSTTDEADYIVMELIDGITLKQYMEKKGVLNWKETLHFGMQIAKALEHAHSRGIVHRDIKPHNIMVLKNGSVKVTDFGIARIMSKSNTLTKEALGSVHYISPEQAKGGRVDNRSDIYSLGVVMYEMMTGRAPYDGESPVSVAIQHINGGAAMPSTLNPNIPGGLEQIIMKAMAVEPDKRYPSATALLYDMEEFRKNPSILFNFGDAGEDVLNIRQGTAQPQEKQQAPQQPRNAAERAAGPRPVNQNAGQTPRAGQRTAQQQAHTQREIDDVERQRRAARERERERREEEERKKKTTKIAVIACSAVAIVAIVIFLIMTLNGGIGSGVDLVEVPNLLGIVYEDLDRSKYPDFTITLANYGYSDEYEAGQIMDQTPSAKTSVAEGSEIKVYVSQGPEGGEEIGTMEDLTNMTGERAEAYMKSFDVKLLVKTENSDEVDEGQVIRTEPAAGETLVKGQTVTIWVSSGKDVVEEYLPSTVGRSYEDALKRLNDKGFNNVTPQEEESTEPIGNVIRMSADPGTKLDVTQEVILYVSKGLSVPDVLGKSYDDAVSALKSKGFTANVTKTTKESTEAKDVVLEQSVTSGTWCEASTKITLTVSEGVKRGTVPDVQGETFESAKKLLANAGFNNVTSAPVDSDQPKGEVADMNAKAGSTIDVTTQIILYISNGPKTAKTLTVSLPADKTEAYNLTVVLDGETVLDKTIQPGATGIDVELVGRDTMGYEVYIDDIPYTSGEVNFDS